MEAMAAGIPVVATDIPGCRFAIDDKETGLLFPVDDVASLAKRIEWMVSDRSLNESICGAARERVVQKFSAIRMATEYHQLYLDLQEH